MLTAQGFRLVEPLGPARRAAYDRYARLEADTQVVERRRGSRELDRRVDSVQVLGRQIVRIVPVDDQGLAVAALDENRSISRPILPYPISAIFIIGGFVPANLH